MQSKTRNLFIALIVIMLAAIGYFSYLKNTKKSLPFVQNKNNNLPPGAEMDPEPIVYKPLTEKPSKFPTEFLLETNPGQVFYGSEVDSAGFTNFTASYVSAKPAAELALDYESYLNKNYWTVYKTVNNGDEFFILANKSNQSLKLATKKFNNTSQIQVDLTYNALIK